jgi:hypothetical protein
VADDPVGVLLGEVLACAEAALSVPVGRAFVAPGREVAWDDCCDGQLWVRLVGTVPAGTSNQQGVCGVVLWSATLALGVVRCAATVNDQGVVPAPAALTTDALAVLTDRWELEMAVRCCVVGLRSAQRVVLLRWEPAGPQGGCVGGEWFFNVAVNVCPC